MFFTSRFQQARQFKHMLFCLLAGQLKFSERVTVLVQTFNLLAIEIGASPSIIYALSLTTKFSGIVFPEFTYSEIILISRLGSQNLI